MAPRSAADNAARREASRAAILDAALRLFGEHGYERTSVAAVAREAGVAQGLVLYYFTSKLGLLEAVCERRFVAVWDVLGTVAELPAADALRAVIDATMTDAVRNRKENALLLGLMVTPSTAEVLSAVESRHEEALRRAEDAIRGFFAAIGSPDPVTDEVLLRSTIEGITFKYAVYGDTYPLEPVRRRTHEMFGLGTPPSPIFPMPDGETRLRA